MVISILLILVALLLPALVAVKKKSNLVQCTSNMRQLSMANIAFLKDNDNYFIENLGQSDFETVGKNGSIEYFRTSYREISNRRMNIYFGGPFSDGDEAYFAKCASDTSSYELRGSSYPMNIGLPHSGIRGRSTLTWKGGTGGANKLEDVKDTTRMIVFSEFGMRSYSKGGNMPDAEFFWHSKAMEEFKWNTTFVDGHVALVEAEFNTKVGDDYTYLIDQ